MSDYIERDSFIKQMRTYCEICTHRKGMRNGKEGFIYEIGDAPCRACYIEDMISAIEEIPPADVRPVVSGRWKKEPETYYGGHLRFAYHCSNCGFKEESFFEDSNCSNFCPDCGASMRKEEQK